MNMLMKPALSALVIICVCLTSCSKNEVAETTPEPNNPIVDSTFLIKSITLASDDLASGMFAEDSLTEHYNYDSLNRKVFLTWSGRNAGGVLPSGIAAEISYNSDWQIVKMAYAYPANFPNYDQDYSEILIQYDEEKILKKTIVKYVDNSLEETNYIKEKRASGYGLSWYEMGNAPDTTWRFASFDNLGRNVINEERIGNGDFFFQDSITYDGIGNVRKIFRKGSEYGGTEVLFVDFVERETKGDNLFNFRSGLLKGISEMPFIEIDNMAFATGLLSWSLDYEIRHYHKFPLKSVRAYNQYQSKYLDLIFSPEVDNKGRVVKSYRYVMDMDAYKDYLKLEYYK